MLAPVELVDLTRRTDGNGATHAIYFAGKAGCKERDDDCRAAIGVECSVRHADRTRFANRPYRVSRPQRNPTYFVRWLEHDQK